MGWKNFNVELGYSHVWVCITTVPKTSPAGHAPCSLLHKQAIDAEVLLTHTRIYPQLVSECCTSGLNPETLDLCKYFFGILSFWERSAPQCLFKTALTGFLLSGYSDNVLIRNTKLCFVLIRSTKYTRRVFKIKSHIDNKCFYEAM